MNVLHVVRRIRAVSSVTTVKEGSEHQKLFQHKNYMQTVCVWLFYLGFIRSKQGLKWSDSDEYGTGLYNRDEH